MKDVQIRKKAQEILACLTLDEKIGMIHGAQLFQTAGVPRLGIPPLKMSDGPMGVRQEFEPDHWIAKGYTDDYVTYLPSNSALAATWNRQLAYELGSVLGEEARGRGKDVILAPGVNIKRSPLCGRNFEYFSEDPYLTKELAVPFIQGVQSWDVAACVKHFAANNQETERLWVDVEIDETALREIYLPAFYDAVTKGGAYTIMGAYNRLYGEHCCQSEFLLNQILRKEWEYDGVVISDWGGVHDTKAAAESQLDIEMSVTDNFDEYFMADPLKKAVENGEVSEDRIDEKVLRILMLMMRLHMLEDVNAENGKTRKSGAYNTPEHQKAVLDAARESVVLLKNDSGRLPLHKNELKRVLMIGENAECIHSNGGGSAEIKALYEISPLMGMKTHLGGNVTVDYAQGYCREEKKEESDVNWQETSLEQGGGKVKEETPDDAALSAKRARLREEAVRLAGEYETVIYVGGLNHDHDSEGNDRRDMKLPYDQDLLIQELLKVKPDMIVVMIGGSPVEMGAWIDQADTLVWGWYAGMEGGNALAEVLLGEVNPSGKLPETFYKKHTDCSAHALGEFPGGDKVAYKEGKYVGYRYNDKFCIEPQFCFGYGLSYTSFAYRDLSVDNEEGTVACYVKNTGDTDGAEVIQIYRHQNGQDEIVQELVGFEKVFLKAGEEKLVTVKTDEMRENCVYFVGSSSRDIRLS
ncbi:MAG: glycoside hydrolase family 3 C-terminal domain-containing protein [Bariatricus sp.]